MKRTSAGALVDSHLAYARKMFAAAGGAQWLTPTAMQEMLSTIARVASYESAYRINTGRPLSEKLKEHAVRKLASDVGADLANFGLQPLPRGIDRRAFAFRDAIIVFVIGRLVERGLDATRNAATNSECACSIVSTALREINVHLSEKRLAEIWARRVEQSDDDRLWEWGAFGLLEN